MREKPVLVNGDAREVHCNMSLRKSTNKARLLKQVYRYYTYIIAKN